MFEGKLERNSLLVSFEFGAKCKNAIWLFGIESSKSRGVLKIAKWLSLGLLHLVKNAYKLYCLITTTAIKAASMD